MRTRPIRMLLLPCSAALLMSCAAADAPPPVVTVVNTPPPAALVIPPPRPALPPEGARLSQGQTAELLLRYDAALQAAIAQLCAVAGLYQIIAGDACAAAP